MREKNGKREVSFVLKRQAMKRMGGVKLRLYVFLTSASNEGELAA
jgi:hypothetical protein